MLTLKAANKPNLSNNENSQCRNLSKNLNLIHCYDGDFRLLINSNYTNTLLYRGRFIHDNRCVRLQLNIKKYNDKKDFEKAIKEINKRVAAFNIMLPKENRTRTSDDLIDIICEYLLDVHIITCARIHLYEDGVIRYSAVDSRCSREQRINEITYSSAVDIKAFSKNKRKIFKKFMHKNRDELFKYYTRVLPNNDAVQPST